MARPRVLGVALLGAGLFVLGIAGAAAWVFYTTAGLEWLATRSAASSGDRVRIEGVSGTLAAGAHARVIELATDELSVRAQEARFTLSPWSLLTLAPRISDLGAARVEIRIEPGDDPRSPLPDSLALPLDVAIHNARIDTLVFDDTIRVVELQNVHLEYAGGKRRHEVRELDFSLLGHAFALRGSLDTRKPFALEAHVAAVRPVEPRATMAVNVTGTLAELRVQADVLAAAASARAQATLRPGDPQPIVALEALIRNLDPHALDARLPRAKIDAELALVREDGRLQGPVTVRNALPGSVDEERLPLASLQADVLARLPAVAFSHLRADLGAGGLVTGSGELEGEQARLKLTFDALDLRAIHSALRQTRLAGAARLELGPTAQRAVGELAQADIRLALAAERKGDSVVVEHFEAQARGGSVEGKAHLDLGGPKPFGVQALLRRFDPSAWGDFPAGSINATLRAEGVLQEPSARVEFALDESRWLDAPLAGKGVVAGSAQRVRQADVQIALGPNRLAAKGAFGGKGDSLALTFDAPQLEVLDPRLRGGARGTGTMSGTFQAPSLQLDARAAELSFANYGSIATAEVRARASLEADAPIEMRAVLSGVKTAKIALRSARLHVDGRLSQHEARLDLAGDPIDLRLRLRGALAQGNVWSGTVLELVNRGEIPIELARPVQLELTRNSVRVEPFELRAVGGRLSVDALDYGRDGIDTRGSFHALPVVRLIELIDAKAPVKGSLRLTGRWELAASPQWRGSVSVARESGNLLVGAGNPIDLGVSALAASAEIDAAKVEFRASAELALARAVASGRIGAVEGAGALPFTAASPLEFTAAVDVARLAPFADFIDTAMIVRGEASARLQGSGTLGDPRITGRVSADGIGLMLPAEGVNLTGGTLAATITPEEIRIESLAIRGGEGMLTAQGTFSRAGYDRASIDWRAERFTALERPDRKLVVSGQGTAGLQDKRISIRGRAHVIEGEFAIGESSLPTLSSDVVIVGRKPSPAAQQPRTFKNLALDLVVDLGNRMHLSGQGLSVWLAGELRIITDPQGQLRATGTVRTRDGTFVAYGQRLEIERGNFYFNGPLQNPGLDIVAMRKRQAVEAGVALTGTLQAPLVRVVSDPPLPEGEALSWLVLGRSPNEAGTGELSALPLAGNLLLGKATTPLKDALKLDEFGVRGGAAGEQMLTLGKRLTDRLYLVFEQGFGAAETLLRLEYTLTRRIVLRLQAGEPSGGGIFYRRRWD